MIAYVDCLSPEPVGNGMVGHCWNGQSMEDEDQLLPRKMVVLQPKTEGSLRRRLLTSKIHQQKDVLWAPKSLAEGHKLMNPYQHRQELHYPSNSPCPQRRPSHSQLLHQNKSSPLALNSQSHGYSTVNQLRRTSYSPTSPEPHPGYSLSSPPPGSQDYIQGYYREQRSPPAPYRFSHSSPRPQTKRSYNPLKQLWRRSFTQSPSQTTPLLQTHRDWRALSVDEESHWSVHYTTQTHQAFLQGPCPYRVDDLQARVNLHNVLRECDSLTKKKGYGSAQCYSQSPSSSCSNLLEKNPQDDSPKKKRNRSSHLLAEEESLVFTAHLMSRNDPPDDTMRNEPFHVEEAECFTPHRLPTPEEKMREQARTVPADIIPIDISGESFERQANFRRALAYTDTFTRRSCKLIRRQTITGIDDFPNELGETDSIAVDLPGQYSTVGRTGNANTASALRQQPPCLTLLEGEGETQKSAGMEKERKAVKHSARRIRAQRGQGISSLMASLTTTAPPNPCCTPQLDSLLYLDTDPSLCSESRRDSSIGRPQSTSEIYAQHNGSAEEQSFPAYQDHCVPVFPYNQQSSPASICLRDQSYCSSPMDKRLSKATSPSSVQSTRGLPSSSLTPSNEDFESQFCFRAVEDPVAIVSDCSLISTQCKSSISRENSRRSSMSSISTLTEENTSHGTAEECAPVEHCLRYEPTRFSFCSSPSHSEGSFLYSEDLAPFSSSCLGANTLGSHSYCCTSSVLCPNTLTRSISLRKAKRPPQPPARCESLRRRPVQSKLQHNSAPSTTSSSPPRIFLSSPPSTSCPQSTFPLSPQRTSSPSPHLEHRTMHSKNPPVSFDDPWVPRIPEKNSREVTRVNSGTVSTFLPTDPVNQQTELIHSVFPHLPKGCHGHPQASTSTANEVGKILRLSPRITTSPMATLQNLASPSSGYSSQADTPSPVSSPPPLSSPLSITPSSLPRHHSPPTEGRPKPLVPERKSSLVSSRSSFSSTSSLSSCTSTDSSGNRPPLPLPPPLPGSIIHCTTFVPEMSLAASTPCPPQSLPSPPPLPLPSVPLAPRQPQQSVSFAPPLPIMSMAPTSPPPPPPPPPPPLPVSIPLAPPLPRPSVPLALLPPLSIPLAPPLSIPVTPPLLPAMSIPLAPPLPHVSVPLVPPPSMSTPLASPPLPTSVTPPPSPSMSIPLAPALPFLFVPLAPLPHSTVPVSPPLPHSCFPPAPPLPMSIPLSPPPHQPSLPIFSPLHQPYDPPAPPPLTSHLISSSFSHSTQHPPGRLAQQSPSSFSRPPPPPYSYAVRQSSHPLVKAVTSINTVTSIGFPPTPSPLEFSELFMPTPQPPLSPQSQSLVCPIRSPSYSGVNQCFILRKPLRPLITAQALQGVQLRSVSKEAKLSSPTLANTKLTRATLANATLTDATLAIAKLTNATLTNATLCKSGSTETNLAMLQTNYACFHDPKSSDFHHPLLTNTEHNHGSSMNTKTMLITDIKSNGQGERRNIDGKYELDLEPRSMTGLTEKTHTIDKYYSTAGSQEEQRICEVVPHNNEVKQMTMECAYWTLSTVAETDIGSHNHPVDHTSSIRREDRHEKCNNSPLGKPVYLNYAPLLSTRLAEDPVTQRIIPAEQPDLRALNIPAPLLQSKQPDCPLNSPQETTHCFTVVQTNSQSKTLCSMSASDASKRKNPPVPRKKPQLPLISQQGGVKYCFPQTKILSKGLIGEHVNHTALSDTAKVTLSEGTEPWARVEGEEKDTVILKSTSLDEEEENYKVGQHLKVKTKLKIQYLNEEEKEKKPFAQSQIKPKPLRKIEVESINNMAMARRMDEESSDSDNSCTPLGQSRDSLSSALSSYSLKGELVLTDLLIQEDEGNRDTVGKHREGNMKDELFSSTTEESHGRPRTTDDLFAVIHRYKRKVLGRRNSIGERGHFLSSSTSQHPLLICGQLPPRLLQRSGSRERFKALLLNKGRCSSPAGCLSAVERLSITAPKHQSAAPLSQHQIYLSVKTCTSFTMNMNVSQPQALPQSWPRSLGIMMNEYTDGSLSHPHSPSSPSQWMVRAPRSLIPPCSSSRRFAAHCRSPRLPLTAIFEGEEEGGVVLNDAISTGMIELAHELHQTIGLKRISTAADNIYINWCTN